MLKYLKKLFRKIYPESKYVILFLNDGSIKKRKAFKKNNKWICGLYSDYFSNAEYVYILNNDGSAVGGMAYKWEDI
jgi:hypothetical protein